MTQRRIAPSSARDPRNGCSFSSEYAQWRKPQGKLVRATLGRVFDVAVDARRGSPTFTKWVGVELSDDNFKQLYLPPGFLHGFLVLSDAATVEYKCTELYDPGGELTVIWDDPAIGIRWPLLNPLVSPKDADGQPVKALEHRLPDWDSP